jgi:hypothetical protein
MESWLARVANYCDLLNRLSIQLLIQLEKVQAAVLVANTEQILQFSDELSTSLRELTPLHSLRDSLLLQFVEHGGDRGPPPDALRTALTRLATPDALALCERCDQLKQDILAVHEKANALFLAEYTLAQTAGDFLSLLTTGISAMESYAERPNQVTAGRILDRAA